MDRNGMFLYTALDIFASIAPHYVHILAASIGSGTAQISVN